MTNEIITLIAMLCGNPLLTAQKDCQRELIKCVKHELQIKNPSDADAIAYCVLREPK
jgi:hypothetical protein